MENKKDKNLSRTIEENELNNELNEKINSLNIKGARGVIRLFVNIISDLSMKLNSFGVFTEFIQDLKKNDPNEYTLFHSFFLSTMEELENVE